MKKEKKIRPRGRYAGRGAAVAVIAAALLAALSAAVPFYFITLASAAVEDSVKDRVMTSADAVAYETNYYISSLKNMLETAASALESAQVDPAEAAASMSFRASQYIGFRYCTVDEFSVMALALGISADRADATLFGESGYVTGILVNSSASPWNHTFVIARGLLKDGERAGVLVCESFAGLLLINSQMTGDTGELHIVTQGGDIVPVSYEQLVWQQENGSNIIIAKESLGMDGRSSASLRSALQEGKRGLTVYESDGVKVYTAYSPISLGDWRAVYIYREEGLPGWIADLQTVRTIVLATGAVTLLALAALAVWLFFEPRRKDFSRIERLSLLSDFTGDILFEYQPAKGRLIFSKSVRRALPSLATNVLNIGAKGAGLSFVHPEDGDIFRRALSDGFSEPVVDIQVRLRVRESQYENFCLRCEPLKNSGGRTIAVMGMIENVSGIDLSLRLNSPVNIDQLTKLPNYNGTRLRIERALAAGEVGALLLVDLNRLADANTKYGMDAIDEHLIKLARVIAATFRRDDIVGRTAGDEFMVFMVGAEGYDIISRKAEQLLERIESAGGEDGPKLPAGIGVAITALAGYTFESVSEAAKKALAIVKQDDTAAYRFYSGDN